MASSCQTLDIEAMVNITGGYTGDYTSSCSTMCRSGIILKITDCNRQMRCRGWRICSLHRRDTGTKETMYVMNFLSGGSYEPSEIAVRYLHQKMVDFNNRNFGGNVKGVLVIGCLLLSINENAQGVLLRGAVRDAFTNVGIENAYVVLLDTDSMAVTSGFARIPSIRHDLGNGTIREEKDNTQGAVFQLEVAADREYILSVSMLGYDPECRKIELRRTQSNKPIEMDAIYLLPKSTELDELTVKATKLKVYHKGDTLVYDADAFVMEKHNVLEDLVRQLPDVELRGGRVYVNGRFVDNIVLGGKDFLKSDPKQLMAMLPAYIVDKLKFYEKSGEQSKTMGKDMHDSSYVMDITMKRDYHGAWLGNASVGGGTETRWGGVGFAMYYDDRQAFTLSLDGNNLGLSRMASSICTDIEDTSGMEDSRNLQVDLGYSYHPTDRLRIDSHFRLRRIDRQEGLEDIFTSNGAAADRIMRRTSKESDTWNRFFSGDAGLTWRPRKGIYGRIAYAVDHGSINGDESSESLTATGEGEKPSNFYRDISSSRQKTWMHRVSAETQMAVSNNLLRISASFKAGKGEQSKHRDFLSQIFSEAVEEKSTHNLFDTRKESHSVDAGVDYDLNYADDTRRRGILTSSYRMVWENESNDRLLYDIQASDSRQYRLLNRDGSREIGGKTLGHRGAVSLKHEFQTAGSRWMMLSARMTADVVSRNADCRLFGDISATRRHFLLLSPEMALRWHPKPGDRKGNGSTLELKIRMTQQAPSTADLADYTDNSDPMNILTGNPSLKKQTETEVSLEYRHYFKRSRSSLHATLGNTNKWDGISMMSFYDLNTGIRRISPVNAGAARETSLDLGYSVPITRGQTWWLNIGARGSLGRSQNLTVTNQTDGDRQYMDFGNYLTRVGIRHNGARITGSYEAAYQGSVVAASFVPGTSLRSLTQELNLQMKLPARWEISADCNAVSRFGYVLPSLDRTVFLLNASIQKSLLGDRLNLSLSAVDLLRRRKNAFSVVDGAGVTESMRTRFIPSYIMLSLYYRWAQTPKKR